MTEQAPDRKTFNKKILIPIAIAAVVLIAILAIIMVAKYGNTGASNSGTASCALGATGINPIACRRDHF